MIDVGLVAVTHKEAFAKGAFSRNATHEGVVDSVLMAYIAF